MQHKNAQNVFIIPKRRQILPSNVLASNPSICLSRHTNTRRTRSIGVLQMEQPLGMFATASAQFEQKRECPQGTRATPVVGGKLGCLGVSAQTVADGA